MTPLSKFWTTSPHFRGAVWKISSYLCFAAINGIVRYLSQTSEGLGQTPLPAYEVAFFQNLLGLIFLLPWIVNNGPSSLKSQKPFLQASRVCLSAVGVIIWYYSLTKMPLAQAVALMFLSPLITTLGARLFLKEQIGLERGTAILIGFIGGGIISHTSFSTLELSLIALCPILAASCFSGSTLMLRRLIKDDSPQLTVIYLLVFMAPVLMIPTLYDGIWPEVWQWPWLLAMGGFAAAANFSLSKAFTSAEVSYLVPYSFTKWFASAFIGFAAFAEVPTWWTICGAITIMFAIVSLSYAEVRRKMAISTA